MIRPALTATRERRGASLLVGSAADEVAFLSEMIVDGGVDRAELLQGLHPAEAGHRPLPSSKGKMAVLRPIVLPAADLGDSAAPICFEAAQPIRDDRLRLTCRFSAFLMNFSAAALSRSLVTKDSSTSPSWSTLAQRRYRPANLA
jgi:hypothetical protein